MRAITYAFFSIVEVADPRLHGEFNRWHGCEHQPETFTISVVSYGQRWTAPQRLMDARLAIHPAIAPHQYFTYYLFSQTLEEVLKDYPRRNHGGRTAFDQKNSWNLGFHAFRKAYVSPRIRVTPEALPFRPNRGVFAVVDDINDPALEPEASRWLDEVWIPGMLGVKGVMGCYWFQSLGQKLGNPSSVGTPENRRVLLYYLDEDPMSVALRLKDLSTRRNTRGRASEPRLTQPILAGAYMSVPDPERFDWHRA